MNACPHERLIETTNAIVRSSWAREEDGSYAFIREEDVEPHGGSRWTCADCYAVVEIDPNSPDIRLADG